jgi:hypothetical protein
VANPSLTGIWLTAGACKKLIYFVQIEFHPIHPRLLRHATTFSSWRGSFTICSTENFFLMAKSFSLFRCLQ